MNISNLKFQDESFDKIICLEVFEHLTLLQTRKAIIEIFRVLKNGGCFIGSTPLRLTQISTPSCYAHIYEYSESELRELLNCFSDITIADNNFFSGRKSSYVYK